jgi:hypothetical protein
MSLSDAAKSGDRRKTLEELRDVLASTVDEAQPQYRAALAKQLAAVMVELAEIAPARKDDAVDELTSKRRKRHAS